MKNREITFVLRLRKDTKGAAASLGLDLKKAAKEIEKATGGKVRNAKVLTQTAVQSARAANEEVRARLQVQRLRRADLAVERAESQLANARTRQEITSARATVAQARVAREEERNRTQVATNRIRLEREQGVNDRRTQAARDATEMARDRRTALRIRTELQAAVGVSRLDRARTQHEVAQERLANARRNSEAAARLAEARGERSQIATARDRYRLADGVRRAEAAAQAAGVRLTNARLVGERTQISMARQRLALEQAQLRAQDAAERRRLRNQRRSGGGAIKNALGSGITQIAAGVGAASIARLADEYTLLNARVKLVTKSEAEHAAVMTELKKSALDTRIGLKATTDVYYSLARNNKALGLSQREMIALTDGINQSIVISGTSAQSANYALIQLGQAFGTGQLRGEELNSVLEQMPRLAQAIAEELGVGVPGALKTMAEAGKLTVPAVLGAIQKSLPKLAEEFKRMPITAGQGLTSLKTGLQILIGEFDKTSGATRGLGKMVFDLGQKLASPEFIRGAVEFGEHMATVFRAIGNVAGVVFPFLLKHIKLVTAAFVVLASVMLGMFVARAVQGVITGVASMAAAFGGAAAASTAAAGVTVASMSAIAVSIGVATAGISLLVAAIGYLIYANLESTKTSKAVNAVGKQYAPLQQQMADNTLAFANATAQSTAQLWKEREAIIANARAKHYQAISDQAEASNNLARINNQIARDEKKGAWLAAQTGKMTRSGIIEDLRVETEALKTSTANMRQFNALANQKPGNNILDFKPPKLDLPSPAPKKGDKDKTKKVKDEWKALVDSIDPARASAEKMKDALELLDANVEKGSTTWLAYRDAIERSMGFSASPLAQANQDIREQLPLLDILNDKERQRAETLAQAVKAQKEGDPTGMYAGQARAMANNLQKNLLLKDEKELRNELLKTSQDTVRAAQEELILQGLSTEQANIQSQIFEAMNRARETGLFRTEEQIRAYLIEKGVIEDIIKAEELRTRNARNPIEGAKAAMRDYFEEAKNVGTATFEAVGNAIKGIEDLWVEFATTGKFAFKEFARSVISDIIRIIARLLIMKAIMAAMNFIVPGSGTAFGAAMGVGAKLRAPSTVAVGHNGGIAGRSTGSTASVAMSAFHGARKMHTGGVVGRDEVPIIAKKGEALLPTVRLPNGRMGVEATGMGGSGGGGMTFAPNINVTVNPGAGGSNDTEGGRKMGGEVGRAITSAMDEWAIKNMRPGGLLNSVGRG